MRRSISHTIVVGLLTALATAGCARESHATYPTALVRGEHTMRVVAYLPDYRIDTLDPGATNGVTDLIYFSAAPSPSGDLDLARVDAAHLLKLRTMTTKTHTRLLLALGGADRSNGFGSTALYPGLRARFLKQLLQYCLDNKLDGVDYDWEGPATSAEEQAYSALLVDTHKAFRSRKLRVTIAIASYQKLDHAGIDAVDEMHLMAYDHEGKHSTMEQAKADVQECLKNGWPKQKIMLGLPFYGRKITNANSSMTYAEIVAQFHPAPDIDEVSGIYFNGQTTIGAKTRYAIDNRLGGVMIWELGQDTSDETSLMKAILRENHL